MEHVAPHPSVSVARRTRIQRDFFRLARRLHPHARRRRGVWIWQRV